MSSSSGVTAVSSSSAAPASFYIPLLNNEDAEPALSASLPPDLPSSSPTSSLDDLDVQECTGTMVACCLWDGKMKLRDMRNHVGKHILLALRDIDENVVLKPGMKVCDSSRL